MAQENEHIQTLVAELEHRREVEKALAEVADQALVDEERDFGFTFTRGIVALGRFSWRPRHLLRARRSSQQ